MIYNNDKRRLEIVSIGTVENMKVSLPLCFPFFKLKLFILTSIGRSTRPEWSSRYYTSTTTVRPRWQRPDELSSEKDDNTRNTQHRTYSVSHGTSHSDSRHLPGPFTWYNRTVHWTDNRTRGYDADLDGTTLPTPIEDEKTYDEEEWDGTDFYTRPFDDRHPLGLIKTKS